MKDLLLLKLVEKDRLLIETLRWLKLVSNLLKN